jgi:hypothetical protein
VKGAAYAYKTAWIQALDNTGNNSNKSSGRRNVVLLELTPPKGKTLNGSVVQIAGPRNARQLTGESERLTFKTCNLSPTATLPKSTISIPDEPLIRYSTSNAKLLRSHGMVVSTQLAVISSIWRSEDGCASHLFFAILTILLLLSKYLYIQTFVIARSDSHAGSLRDQCREWTSLSGRILGLYGFASIASRRGSTQCQHVDVVDDASQNGGDSGQRGVHFGFDCQRPHET